MRTRILGLCALLAAAAAAAPLAAQAYAYPALQPSRIAEREYNFVLADGGNATTALIFQWREGMGNPKLQFTMDAGFADPEGNAETRLIIGGGLAYQIATATDDMPFDIVLAGGLGMTTGDNFTTMRIPFGAVVGHRFALENEFAISPFVHPRLSWNRISGGGNSTSDTQLDVDIGATFELKPRMSIRLAAALGDDDAIGISFAYSPRGLRK